MDDDDDDGKNDRERRQVEAGSWKKMDKRERTYGTYEQHCWMGMEHRKFSSFLSVEVNS